MYAPGFSFFWLIGNFLQKLSPKSEVVKEICKISNVRICLPEGISHTSDAVAGEQR
jgi:hypothetical protein